MTELQIAIIVILALVNFPLVIGFDRWASRGKQCARRVYDLAPTDGQTRREIRNSIATTPVHALLIAGAVYFGVLDLAEETVGVAALTFVVTFLWTEIWHYASHRLMHTRPLHFIHVEHHRSRVTQAWTSVSFSFLEKLIFSAGIVGFMSLLSHFLPTSFYGLCAYYFLYFFTNTLGHSNVEIRRPGYTRTIFGKLFNTPAYHAIHHARYTGNYGLLTPWPDRVFGTAWEDSGEVQSRAALGQPLKHLRERALDNGRQRRTASPPQRADLLEL